MLLEFVALNLWLKSLMSLVKNWAVWKYCGKLVTISEIDKNKNAYFIKDDKKRFSWVDREGNEDDKYIGNIITDKYTFNTAAKPPTKSTLNNTNVYVRNKINDPWKPTHFVCMSAFTANGYTENFKYAKLAE